jgi:hypothetical protein
VSWRVKALQRAQQLAKEQGKDLNEVTGSEKGKGGGVRGWLRTEQAG